MKRLLLLAAGAAILSACDSFTTSENTGESAGVENNAVAARATPGFYDLEITASTNSGSGTGVNGPGIQVVIRGSYGGSPITLTKTLGGNLTGTNRFVFFDQTIDNISSITVTNNNYAKQIVYPYNPYPFGWVYTDLDWAANGIVISVTDHNLNQKAWTFPLNTTLLSRQSCRVYQINFSRTGMTFGPCKEWNPVSYGTATSTGIPTNY